MGFNYSDRIGRAWRYFVDWRRQRSIFQPVFFNRIEDLMAVAERWLELMYPRVKASGGFGFYGRVRSLRRGMGQRESWDLWVEIALNDK